MNSKKIALYLIYSILIAGVYYGFAIISKPLLLPPTFAAPIWAPAGIGVGVLTLWGYRYIPAIILGETLTTISFYGLNFFITHPVLILTFGSLVLIISFRSALATYLVNTHLGKSNNYLTLQSVTKLLVFAAIIPSFISSIVATFILYSNGMFYFDSWAVNFFTWWFGDAVGISVMLPIVFLLFKKPRNIWYPRLYKTLAPIIITFILLIIATSNIKKLELTRLVDILNNKIELLHKEVINKFKRENPLNSKISEHESVKAINSIYKNELDDILIQHGLKDIHFSIFSDIGNLGLVHSNQEINKSKIFESQNDFSPYQQWKTSKDVYFLTQKWQIDAHASSASYFKNSSWLIWWLTSIGFLFIAILGAGLLVITGSQLIVKEAVVNRTNEIKTLNEILRQSENRYKQLIEIQPVIFWKHIIGGKVLDFISNEAMIILGYTKNELLNLNLFWNRYIHPDDRSGTLKKYYQGIDSNQRFTLKYRALAKNGKYIWFKDYISSRVINGKIEIIGLKIDITKDKLREKEIVQLAYYDSMTGLPNRVKLMHYLKKAIKKSVKKQKFGAVLYLDLDRFKVLNDSMGHYFGDELLIQISQRFKSVLSGKDIASRFGGDEFVVLIGKQNKSLDLITKKSLKVAKTIQKIVKEPFNIDGHNFFTSFSIGVSIFPHNSQDENEIIQQADIAMYASKEQGKNTVNYFKIEMQQLANKRLIIEKSLKQAIISNEFEMYYQPIFDQNKNIIKFEALIRWNHPLEGLLTPNSFISIAEETGYIIELSEWIFGDVIKQITKWGKSNFAILEVSINVSLFQFINSQIVETLEKATTHHKVDSKLITLELTESIGIMDFEEVLIKLKQLSELGFKIAIDDFGTGYSSFDYLMQMPIDTLKLDKSFVANIGKEKNSHSLIETIILMAKQLNLELIVEGVETEEQFNFLKERGCTRFQGFLASQALPVLEIDKLMKKIS